MIVIIDPGHAKKVPGKKSPDGRLQEWQWAREMTGLLEKELDALGIIHTRTTPPSEDGEGEIGLGLRCRRANKFFAEHGGKDKCVFVSIHCNASGSDGKWHSPSGWSVFVYRKGSKNSRRLATEMAGVAKEEGIKVRTPMPGQSYWEAGFQVLRDTSMPAVLVENMFQDNQADVDFLLSDEGKAKLLKVMVEGIKRYFEK